MQAGISLKSEVGTVLDCFVLAIFVLPQLEVEESLGGSGLFGMVREFFATGRVQVGAVLLVLVPN
jgi:hypothetical protein